MVSLYAYARFMRNRPRVFRNSLGTPSRKSPNDWVYLPKGRMNVSDQPADVEAKVLSELAKHERLSDFLNRIEQRRQQLGYSERRAAVKAGLSPSQIRTMRRQWRLGKQRGASVRTVAGLAQALQTTPEWLISGTGPEQVLAEAQRGPAALPGLRLMGAVGAGLWQAAAFESNETQLAPAPADPRFPPEYQSAYEVRGTSIDRLARPGDFLIVLDRKAAGLPLRSGDIVIVTRTKNGLRETTARRLRTRMSAPGCELTFESHDPQHNVGIWLPDQESTDSLSLGGIVVGAYRPLA
jgi:transcriptional regulator with XRE-family HTH domain